MTKSLRKIGFRSLILAVVACMLLGAMLVFIQPLTVKAAQTIEGFTMEETAQVRQYGFVGLRFSVNVESGVKSQYSDADYGTILIPEDMLTGELTHGTSDILDIPTSQWQNENVYTSVLAGTGNTSLPESYYNRNIVARGYIKVGNTYYYTTNTITRSIGYVAAMNVANGKETEILKDIASKTDTKFSFVTENTDRVLSGYSLVFDGKNDGSGNYYNTTLKNAINFFNDKVKAITGANIAYHGNYGGTSTAAVWSEDAKYIVFGDKDGVAEAAGVSAPASLMGEDGYYITTKGNSIFIQVTDDDAYQLAVLKLLNVLFDYEMYAADCETYTYNGSVTIPDMQIVVRPDVDYRNRGNYLSVGGGTYGMGYTNNNIFMAVGGNGYLYHTALDLLDPSKYYGDHNDWFYLYSQNSSWWDQITGETRYDHYQLCYSTIDDSDINTSGSALNIIYNNIKAVVDANPNLENLSLGPADNNYVCDCSNCKADLSTYGSNSGAYVSVANKLAAKLREDYPDRTVNLVVFAYRQYEAAPTNNITVDQNVGVMVAPIESNWSTALRGQTEVANNIKAWAALTDNMYFWFYQTNFNQYFYPLNSYGVMADNIKFAKENGAKYLFYQGAGDKNVSHFSKLKDYVESKLMVDSSLDYNTLVDNFFNAYYGAGAEDMKTYFTALQSHMATFSNGGYKEDIATKTNWSQAKLQEFMGYINSASAKVESGSVYAQHIKLESMFPRYALLSLYNDTTTAGSKAAFMTDCDAFEIVNFCEGKTLESELSSWRHTHNYNVENPVAENLATEATCSSPATYYYTCSCGLKGTATFTYGSTADHSYTFAAGEGADEGYDVGTCTGNCGTTVKVKTDYTDGAPVDVINGTEATFTMPEGFVGTVTGVKFGTQDVGYADGKINTTSIQQASHGTWEAIEVTFTSSYGATHTAKVPVTLITKVISTKADFETFATEASNAWAGGTVMYGYYILDADIDCNGTSVSAADAWNNGQFYGTLDGRGHTISNLTATAYKTGIFGRFHGTMKNISFTGVKMNANSALFGKITDGSTFTNVTIGIASWATPTDNTYTGIFGLSQNQNLVLNNVVINVADGITVPQLIGRTFTGATGNITLNLGVDVTVVNYYSTANNGSSGVTTLPTDSIFTVNQKVAQIIDTETIIEGNTMPVADLSDGNVTVVLGGNTYNGTVASGVLTISGTLPTATGKQSSEVVITQGDDKYTYTNIWHVTQVIDTVAELKTLGTLCKDNVVTGYYILGGDIDCSAETTMSNGSGSTTTNGFQGTFDGRDHTISNITMNGYGGLFGKLLGATIKNTTFDNVNLSTNGSLFAVGADKNSTTNTNTSLRDIVINLSSYNTGYGVVVGYSMFNTVGSGIVINVADGLTVTSLLCRDNCNTLAGGYITATVNLGANSTITNYCSGTTTPPSTFTVNKTEAYEPTVETYDELVAGEGTTSLTFTNNLITAGNASVTIDGGAVQTVTATDGSLTVNLGSVAMGQHTVVITTPNGDILTYTNVWYVTQVIDTVAELKALGAACKAANTTGYYILGGNIDCSAEANMAAGNPGWQTNGFSGTFDGRGYTISNIKMTWDNATSGYGGLFGNLAGCTIQNVVFDKVNYASTNVSLFGRHSYASGGNNVNIKNVTINVSGWGATGTDEAGVLLSKNMLNTITANVTVNIANGLTVNTLLGADCSSIAYVVMTVNLGSGSTITNYYGTTTAKPNTITVNGAREPVVATLDTLIAGENATNVTFTHDAFADSTSATVVINGVTKENVAISGGTLTLNLADYNVTTMGQYSAVITTNHNDVLTFNDVWYVTQVIDDAAELKALGTLCKDSVVTGYYILGGDVNCSSYVTMSNGSASTTTNGFAGTFDGRGKTISNIKMTWDSATSGLGGLFGKLLGATIQNTVFDNVNLGTNGTLLASGADKNSSTNTNTTLKNLTINLTGYSTGYGVVVGYSMFNTVGSGLVFNIADSLTVAKLMARDNCNSIGYIYATVNLGTGSTITNYYSTTTAKPNTFTVNNK